MNAPVQEGPRKKYYLLHRWIGLALGLIATVVFFSGAIAIFHREIDDWSSRGHRHLSIEQLDGFDFDETYRTAEQQVEEAYRHDVAILNLPNHPLGFYFHRHVKAGRHMREEGYAVFVDPETNEVERKEFGPPDVLRTVSAPHALSRFFLDLHLYLLMPKTLGLWATGLVGFALCLLVTSGVFVHRPSFKKMTRRPRVATRRGLMGDLHTLVGSWTLPFTGILSLTGTFFSFATAVLIPLLTIVAFSGDREALEERVMGVFSISDSPEQASLNEILKDARERGAGAEVRRMALSEWGNDEARATLVMVESTSTGEDVTNFVYDGHTGAFIQEKPNLGLQPSLGDSLVTLMRELHFGTLLGMYTKVIWSLFGLSTCALSAMGLVIFVERRRKTKPSPIMEACTVALLGGLPLSSAGAALAWSGAMLLSLPNPAAAMKLTFFGLLALSLFSGTRSSLRNSVSLQWLVTAAALVLLLTSSPLVSGLSFGEIYADPALSSSLVVDLVLVLLVLTLGLLCVALRRFAPSESKSEDLGSLSAAA